MNRPAMAHILLVLVALSITAYGGSEWYLARNKSQAAAARQACSECQRLVAKIAVLRERRATALLQTRPAEELTRRIETWALASGLAASQLLRIEPHPPRRVGDSPYLDQSTQIEITGAELAKIVQLAERALAADESLSLPVLRLTAPRRLDGGVEGPELWQAELVLACRIYAPAAR